MKILHATEVEAGGTISVMALLIAHQLKHPKISDVICLAPSNSRLALTNTGLSRFYTYTRTGRNFLSLSKLLWVLFKTTLKEKPDVIHLHSTYAGFLARFFLTPVFLFYGTKVIYCPHGYSFLMEGSSSKKRIFSLVERMLSLAPQKIICVSQFERSAAIATGIDHNKINVVYNGVADTEQRPATSNNSGDIINFVFLGRNDKAKGFDILLQAMNILRDARIRLTVIGIASHEIDAAQLFSNVEFKGWLTANQVRIHLLCADVLVLPSRWEGLPMAALEAMSAGLPVLASNCTSIPEAIEHGVNGLIFPIGDAKQLAQLMSTTPLEVWRLMGANARTKFEHEYRASRMCEATFDVYLSMLNKRG